MSGGPGAVARARLAPEYTVARVINGGWQLSEGHRLRGTLDAEESLSAMEAMTQAGLTTFDCADIYTGVEEMIGRFLRRRRAEGAASDVQVHTKFVPDKDRLSRLSRADVERIIDRSLQRLGVERLDLVQFHWWDYDVPGWVEAGIWLADLRKAGKIRNLGVTNFDVEHLRPLMDAGVPIVSNQVQYSILDRRPEQGMTAFCAENGISLLCYGALAGGSSPSDFCRHRIPVISPKPVPRSNTA